MPDRPVTRDESPSAVRDALELKGPLPDRGTEAGTLLETAHPRFFGYVTAPPAPIGILGDLVT